MGFSFSLKLINIYWTYSKKCIFKQPPSPKNEPTPLMWVVYMEDFIYCCANEGEVGVGTNIIRIIVFNNTAINGK